jgi:hypothetical protein
MTFSVGALADGVGVAGDGGEVGVAVGREGMAVAVGTGEIVGVGKEVDVPAPLSGVAAQDPKYISPRITPRASAKDAVDTAIADFLFIMASSLFGEG